MLDTQPEPEFDRIIQLLAHLAKTPLALISLVDRNRQWLKTVHGDARKAIDRAISLCSHAIEQKGLCAIEDTLADGRCRDKPLLCGEPRLRFYVGMPLATPDGHAPGTVAVLDRIPRHLSSLQIEALQVMAQIEPRCQQPLLTQALAEWEHSHATLCESEERFRNVSRATADAIRD